MNPYEYQSLKRECDGELLWSYVAKSETLLSIFFRVPGVNRIDGSDGRNMGRKICQAYCDVLWGKNKNSKECRDALNLLDEVDCSLFDPPFETMRQILP